jgi:hypothetical protein
MASKTKGKARKKGKQAKVSKMSKTTLKKKAGLKKTASKKKKTRATAAQKKKAYRKPEETATVPVLADNESLMAENKPSSPLDETTTTAYQEGPVSDVSKIIHDEEATSSSSTPQEEEDSHNRGNY